MKSLYKRSAYDPPVLAFFGLLLYTVSVYTALGERLSFLAAVRHELLIGAVLVVLCVSFLATNPMDIRPYRLVLFAIILLFVSMAVQVPLAFDRRIAWTTFFDRIIKQAMFTLFIAVLVRSPNGLRLFMSVLLFSIFWVLQEAVHGLLTGSLVWYNQGIRRLHGAVTLYRHPNGLSLIAVTALPFIIHLYPAVRRKLPRFAMLVIALLAVVCVLFTGSRAGYIGTLGVLVFWWAYSKHKGRGIAVGGVLAFAVLILMPQDYQDRFMSIGGTEKEGHSKEKRLEIIEDAWIVFKNYPLGVGVDCFPPVRMVMFGRFQDTHNLYFQVATNLGIHGFLVFLFYLAALFWSFDQVVQRQERLRLKLTRLPAIQEFDKPTKRKMHEFYLDVVFAKQSAAAMRLYLLMLIVNGLFAHTLYLVCWWLASGLAIALLNITADMERNFMKVNTVIGDEQSLVDTRTR